MGIAGIDVISKGHFKTEFLFPVVGLLWQRKCAAKNQSMPF